jgi:hypothetical protein
MWSGYLASASDKGVCLAIRGWRRMMGDLDTVNSRAGGRCPSPRSIAPRGPLAQGRTSPPVGPGLFNHSRYLVAAQSRRQGRSAAVPCALQDEFDRQSPVIPTSAGDPDAG